MHDSVWTIDIASIMKEYGIEHRFTTITLGVDTGYSNKVSIQHAYFSF